MSTPSARLGFQKPSRSDRADIEASFASMEDMLDRAAITDHGPVSARPVSTVASPGIAGRRYYADDEEIEYLDTGTAWVATMSKGVSSSGYFIRSTAESRTNNAFGTLPTADQVTVNVPANGLVKLLYSAMINESVAGATKAAIFIGGNQLKVQGQVGLIGSPGPAVRGLLEQQASTSASVENRARPIVSFPGGLAGLETQSSSSFPDDPTTGVAQGFVVDGTGPGHMDTSGGLGGDNMIYELGRDPGSLVTIAGYRVRERLYGGHTGGECIIDNLPAGQYTISIRYACWNGTVTVKNRRLRVKAEKY